MTTSRRALLMVLAGTVTAKARAPTRRLTPAPQFTAPGCTDPCTSKGHVTKKH